LAAKRTLNHVPAKTALVLTGSAIALAGYIGASSDSSGHDGRGARQTGLAAALAASPGAQVTGTGDASLSAVLGYALGSGLSSGPVTSSTGRPGTIALASYGTAEKHPQPRRHARQHPKHHKAPHHHARHRARHHGARHHRARHHRGWHHRGWHHRARHHRGRLHGSPWQIAGSLMPAYHWTSWQFRYLNLLWMRESGWNRFAYNHSSGAYGIPQAVPGDKMASAGPDWRTNARTQIIWGMGYIRGRYGDPWNAWQHELQYGWY
jgi:hypothetical protein